jgi:biopolymer transport protein ExbB/TolQ
MASWFAEVNQLFSMVLSDFFRSADGISIGILLLQGLLFGVCILFFLVCAVELLIERRREPDIVSAFWGAASLTEAVDLLAKKTGAKRHGQLVYQGISAANWHQKQESRSLASLFHLSEWIARALRASLADNKRALNRGVRLLKISTPALVMFGAIGMVWQMMMTLMALHGDELSAKLAVAMVPLLTGLSMALLVWMAYCLLSRWGCDMGARLESFMIDLCGYLVVELNRAVPAQGLTRKEGVDGL